MKKGTFFKKLQENIPEGITPEELKNYPIFTLKEVTDILDKAKADFPKFEQITLPEKNGEVDWEASCKLMEQRNIKREEWFKKWFGES
jgi:hypothetical protein